MSRDSLLNELSRKPGATDNQAFINDLTEQQFSQSLTLFLFCFLFYHEYGYVVHLDWLRGLKTTEDYNWTENIEKKYITPKTPKKYDLNNQYFDFITLHIRILVLNQPRKSEKSQSTFGH